MEHWSMTRVSWENPIIVSPKTAAEWDVISDDAVWLYANGKNVGTDLRPARPSR